MRDKLITVEMIQRGVPALRGRFGGFVTRRAMALCGLNRANELYDKCKQYEGVEFCERVLEELGVDLVVENAKVVERFADGNFVTVSNHPYGHLDGISLIGVVGARRADFKVMANFILALIETLADFFIVVNPFRKGKIDAGALESVKASMAHIEAGHPFGFFPAGKVSKPTLHANLRFTVEDYEWKHSTVRMVKKAGVPVVPVYFSGQNSWFFNFLGMISWKLRTLRLAHELFNKRGRTIYMRFGEPVMPEELAGAGNAKELASFLKGKVYALARPGEAK